MASAYQLPFGTTAEHNLIQPTNLSSMPDLSSLPPLLKSLEEDDELLGLISLLEDDCSDGLWCTGQQQQSSRTTSELAPSSGAHIQQQPVLCDSPPGQRAADSSGTCSNPSSSNTQQDWPQHQSDQQDVVQDAGWPPHTGSQAVWANAATPLPSAHIPPAESLQRFVVPDCSSACAAHPAAHMQLQAQNPEVVVQQQPRLRLPTLLPHAMVKDAAALAPVAYDMRWAATAVAAGATAGSNRAVTTPALQQRNPRGTGPDMNSYLGSCCAAAPAAISSTDRCDRTARAAAAGTASGGRASPHAQLGVRREHNSSSGHAAAALAVVGPTLKRSNSSSSRGSSSHKPLLNQMVMELQGFRHQVQELAGTGGSMAFQGGFTHHGTAADLEALLTMPAPVNVSAPQQPHLQTSSLGLHMHAGRQARPQAPNTTQW